MPLRVMIDSGAYSVWSRGLKIDLDQYIKFCKERPQLDIVVSLDVIPPKNTKLTPETKESLCAEGWSNYLKMIRHLPMEKVLPVHHRGDSFKWLEKMLDFGCPYIGLSPRHDGTDKRRRFSYIEECRKVVLDSSGSPLVKTHGFAVSYPEFMCRFPWYSVDSASWVKSAAWGIVLLPPKTNGEWDFTKQYFKLFTTDRANLAHRRDDWNLLTMKEARPGLYQHVMSWLNEIGVEEGELGNEEVKGVVNDNSSRLMANIGYYIKANSVLPIDHVYLAGSSTGPVATKVPFQLISFAEGAKTVDRVLQNLGVCECL